VRKINAPPPPPDNRFQGCSPNYLANYVMVDFAKITTDGGDGSLYSLAHELGHACNLSHSENGLWGPPAVGNLMNPDPTSRMNPDPNNTAPTLSRSQKVLLRASRHVTFLDPIL
jgi:hypothetical protein